MSELRVIVVGASGRMGRMLVRAVTEAKGAVLAGATERPGSEFLARDAGELAEQLISILKEKTGVLA